MRIHDPEVREDGETREIAARIDDFRLWYRVSKSQPLAPAGDAFVAAALLPAMAEGRELVVDPALTVSPRLLRNLRTFQEIHNTWNPALRIVPLKAVERPSATLIDKSVSFFSGGVDSLFTFLKKRAEIDHVVYIQSFDFPVDEASFGTALARNAAFVAAHGKTVIPVATNSNDFGYHHNLSMLLTQGGVLASVAHLLGFRRAFVSAAYAFHELVPSGSHPLTDPLWSSEAVEIVHEGAEMRRVDKVVRLAKDPAALACLQVCARSVDHNCGECHKCLRTMVSLAIIGAASPAFPPPPPLSRIRRMRVPSHIEVDFIRENYDLAVETKNRAMMKALGTCLRRYERARLVVEADRVLLGGLVKRTYRKLVKTSPEIHRISMTPPKD